MINNIVLILLSGQNPSVPRIFARLSAFPVEERYVWRILLLYRQKNFSVSFKTYKGATENDKNIIRLTRQYLPFPYGRIRDERYDPKTRRIRSL